MTRHTWEAVTVDVQGTTYILYWTCLDHPSGFRLSVFVIEKGNFRWQVWGPHTLKAKRDTLLATGYMARLDSAKRAAEYEANTRHVTVRGI